MPSLPTMTYGLNPVLSEQISTILLQHGVESTTTMTSISVQEKHWPKLIKMLKRLPKP